MPVCHPTRITLSGQYPRHLNHPKWGTYPQAAEGKTFANIANRAGYATAVAWKVAALHDGRETHAPSDAWFRSSGFSLDGMRVQGTTIQWFMRTAI